MKTKKEVLLNLLNKVILNSTDVIDQVLNRDAEDWLEINIKHKDGKSYFASTKVGFVKI
jgi:hypothetical protein